MWTLAAPEIAYTFDCVFVRFCSCFCCSCSCRCCVVVLLLMSDVQLGPARPVI